MKCLCKYKFLKLKKVINEGKIILNIYLCRLVLNLMQ